MGTPLSLIEHQFYLVDTALGRGSPSDFMIAACSSPASSIGPTASATGAREPADVPMEKIVRDNSDHLFPTFSTHIPDSPLPGDPARFNRFDRFKQAALAILESH